jgi:endonuclease/exonuclease/phosphatase family metal-dependent hydrolase
VNLSQALGVGQDRTMRVMTWNLRTETALEPPHWPDRLEGVVSVIEELGPHVLGTQEASARMLDDLAAHLPSRYGWLGEGRLGARNDEFTAVIYDTARFDLLSWRTWWLSDRTEVPGSTAWGAAYPRTATTVRLRDAGDHTTYTFVNAHLDDVSELARLEGARLLAGSLGHDPSVLLGDFNAEAGASEPHAALLDAGLVDAVAPHVTAATPGTFPALGPVVPGGPRVDWVLTTPDLVSTDARVVDVGGREPVPSDHLPVVVDLERR